MELTTILPLLILGILVSISAPPKFAIASKNFLHWQQQDKDSIFREFNDKKRSDPKDAYRIAKLYLARRGRP